MLEKFARAIFSWRMVLGSVAWLALFSQTHVAAKIQGHIFPVTTPIKVTAMESATVNGAPATRIKGVSTKKRGTCSREGIEWRLTDGQQSARVRAFVSDPATVRSEGVQEWEALMVGVPKDKMDSTLGIAHHQCGPFPVQSDFFNAKSMREVATSVE